MKRVLLCLLLFIGGCKKDWYEKGIEAQEKGNYPKAMMYFEKGAKQGDPFCMHSIGDSYQYAQFGMGINRQEAFKWYQRAASAGLLSSHIDIGKAYLYGWGVPEDPKMAIYHFSVSCEGTLDGLCELGHMYYHGIGVEKDYKKAYEYYQQAKEKGSYDAKLQLVVMYARGDYVEQDENKAIKVFTESTGRVWEIEEAKSFLASIIYLNIGYRYLHGEIVPKDEKRAFVYVEFASDWGNNDALQTLAWMYGFGVGTEKNCVKAEELYKKAIKNAEEQLKYFCWYFLGYLYLEGFEPPEYNKAIDCFIKTAEDPSAGSNISGVAMHQLSVLYLSDIGVEYNEDKGKEWFDKAVALYTSEAEEDRAYFMYKLGELYETSSEEVRNIQKARYWYKKAADKGWEEAGVKLKELQG